MAKRKPLVMIDGQEQQLPAGDDIDASSTAIEKTLTNGEAGVLAICTPVYISAADTVLKANAGAAATHEGIGLAAESPSIAAGTPGQIVVSGCLTATIGEWDAVTGDVGGLTPKARYWLDSTTGKLTKVALTAIGEFVKLMGIATSTTEMNVNPATSVLL